MFFLRGTSTFDKLKAVASFTAAVASLAFLIGPWRFSSTGYPRIVEEDLLNSLVKVGGVDPGSPLCSIDLESLRTAGSVSLEQLEKHVVQAAIRELQPGGHWEPKDCLSPYRVALVIPYRDRETHLGHFLTFMHPFLQRQKLNYTVYLVEQASSKPFNRAKLFNVGYLEAKDKDGYQHCLIFHDVDLIPMDSRNIYACTKEPRHLPVSLDMFRFNLPYEELFGGANAILASVFEEVDGFSNRFFGWGGEDDDFRQNRLGGRKIVRFEPDIAKYSMLDHAKADPSPQRFKYLEKSNAGVGASDGLSSTQYRLLKFTRKKQYTHILVEL